MWLDAGDVSAGLRLGAAGGQRGRVHLRGGDGWPGADLEVLAWTRWLILALLATDSADCIAWNSTTMPKSPGRMYS